MNNENKYYYINKLPKEYHRVIWDIMIIAESDMGLYMTLTKDKAKILMRYLYKITKNSDNWNSLIKRLKNKIDNFQDDVSEPILHEQMAMRVIYEYMENLEKW